MRKGVKMGKLGGLLENANDFLEAARRCGWPHTKEKVTRENEPLFIPEMVNISFACELYLKTVAEHKGIKIGRIHELDTIFEKFAKDTQNEIYDIWRTTGNNDIQNHPYYKQMFLDNIGAAANIFKRFRYAHDWVGSVISLEHSYTTEQFVKFSSASGTRPLGSPQVYGGFINQFAECLKIYAERLLGKTYNS